MQFYFTLALLVIMIVAVTYAMANNKTLVDYCGMIEGSIARDAALEKKAKRVMSVLFILLMVLLTLATLSQPNK